MTEYARPVVTRWGDKAEMGNRSTGTVVCPRCSQESANRDRFCRACGSSLPQATFFPGRTLSAPWPSGEIEITITEAAETSRSAYTEVSCDLHPAFRYLNHHGAPAVDSPDLRDAGSAAALMSRLRHSTGGAYLVTGFRGVGKTATVARALELLSTHDPDILTIWTNVARPISSRELLYEIIRRLFEVLQHKRVLKELPRSVSRELVLAYARTSMSIKRSRKESEGISGKLEPSGSFLSKLGIKAEAGFTRSEEAATEASFLEYSVADVEHDFIRIAKLLSEPGLQATRRWWTFWRRAKAARARRLLVIIDELDKLTGTPEGNESFEQLLSGLKNILALSNVHFVLIAGVDLHYRYLRDSRRGNSLYESVFAWHLYVPCTWDSSQKLMAWLSDRGSTMATAWIGPLESYLSYAARGVTRRLVQEFNDLVIWGDTGRAALRLTTVLQKRVRFFDQIEKVMSRFVEKHRSTSILRVEPHDDRWLLGAHHLMDWILSRRDRLFTANEAYERQNEEAVDPHIVLDLAQIGEFLEYLVEARVIIVTEKPEVERTLRGLGKNESSRLYRMAEDIRRQLEVVEPAVASAAPFVLKQTFAERDLRPGVVIRERYEIVSLVGEGGMGGVFKAWDRTLGRAVAIKFMRQFVSKAEDAVERFRREARIILSLRHPGLVRGYELLEDPDGSSPLIVMEFLDGRPLSHELGGPWEPQRAVKLALDLVKPLQLLNDSGYSRIDLKPSNIMLVGDTQRPVLIDFGIAKQDNAVITVTGVVIGTPHYMSPEQLSADPATNIRADLWSIGIILFELLAGHPPFHADNHAELVVRILTSHDVPGLDAISISEPFKAVIRRLLARSPGARYQVPAELEAALRSLPEAAGAA